MLGTSPALKETRQREQRGEIRLPWGRNRVLADVYNEIELSFAGDFSVVFRAYNDGVAYRFRTPRGRKTVRGDSRPGRRRGPRHRCRALTDRKLCQRCPIDGTSPDSRLS